MSNELLAKWVADSMKADGVTAEHLAAMSEADRVSLSLAYVDAVGGWLFVHPEGGEALAFWVPRREVVDVTPTEPQTAGEWDALLSGSRGCSCGHCGTG